MLLRLLQALCGLVVWGRCLQAAAAEPALPQKSSRTAYVSLLYGTTFVEAARVLGNSIRLTSSREMLLLVTSDVPRRTHRSLTAVGWQVLPVEASQNPGKWVPHGSQASSEFPSHFRSVYTKLHIFNMTQYSRVLYLDVDTVVLQSLDPLFDCPGLCGVLRHSEKLNTGVLVATPSASQAAAIAAAVPELPSYTGGDQGFLNAFYPDFAAAPLWDPLASPEEQGSAFWRIPTRYNADVGLYIINSRRWSLPRQEIAVMHFTLGPVKPWHWFAPWICDEFSTWQQMRKRLDRQDAAQGMAPASVQSAGHTAFLLGVPGLVMFWLSLRMSKLLKKAHQLPDLEDQQLALDPHTTGAHSRPSPARAVGVCWLAVPASLAVGAGVVPVSYEPLWGWLLFYEWAAACFCLIMGAQLRHSFLAGLRGQPGVSGLPLASITDMPLSPWPRSSGGLAEGEGRRHVAALLPCVQVGAEARHGSFLSWSGKRQGVGLLGYSWAVLLSALTAVGCCPWVVSSLGVRALIVQVVLTCTLTSLVAGVLLTCACQHVACLWWHAGAMARAARC